MLVSVSVIGTLKERMFITSQVSFGIAEASVKTTLLLHDERRSRQVNTIRDEYLLIPFVIISFIFSLTRCILTFACCRVKTGEAVILQKVLGDRS